MTLVRRFLPYLLTALAAALGIAYVPEAQEAIGVDADTYRAMPPATLGALATAVASLVFAFRSRKAAKAAGAAPLVSRPDDAVPVPQRRTDTEVIRVAVREGLRQAGAGDSSAEWVTVAEALEGEIGRVDRHRQALRDIQSVARERASGGAAEPPKPEEK